MKRVRQGGFTLIELMVALIVSSLLVGMILSIFLRMSLAYRGQQQVANVQGVLAGARAMMEYDAKSAGYGMVNGFGLAGNGGNKIGSVRIVDSSTGPDEVRFFYADPSTQAYVLVVAAGAISVNVDNPAGFAIGDVVVLSNSDLSINNPLGPGTDANIVGQNSCILQISNIQLVGGAWTISFSTTAPYGNGAPSYNATQCPVVAVNTLLYKFVGRAYRIDPLRQTEGVLQLSPSGGIIANDWQDLAYGFTDLQVATQFFDGDGTDTADADADPKREWYSGTTQATKTGPNPPPLEKPIQMTITLVARTDRDVEGIATSATPTLTVTSIPDNNTLGNRPSIPLPSASDDRLKGNRIYRYTTFGVDFRNLGVGL